MRRLLRETVLEQFVLTNVSHGSKPRLHVTHTFIAIVRSCASYSSVAVRESFRHTIRGV